MLVLEKNNLPSSWLWTTIKEICLDPQYGWTTSASKEGKIKFLRTTDITSGKVDWDTVPFCESVPDELEKYQVRKGDIVISRAGSIGFSHLIKSPPKAVFASYLIRFKSLIDSNFFYDFLQSPLYWINISEKKLGIAVQNVNATKLKQICIPLPPLNEQKRIASKIEELFFIANSTIQNLESVKSQLKQYKHSLLKSSFSGILSHEFREKNPKNDVTPLIKSIETHRSKQEKKLQEIDLPENEKPFHDIPQSWKWVRVGNICSKIQYGTSKKANGDSSGIPVLRMGDIVDGELQFGNLKYFPKDWTDKNEFLLENNDVLFNRTNSAELVGKTAIYKNEYPTSVFASYLIRAKLFSEIFLPELLSHYTNSVFGRMFIKSVVSQQVGQANVNGTKFSMMSIPLMPINEQKYISKKIEDGFTSAKNISNEIESRLDSLNSLKHSILKQAFEGKLVPQDPNDEPASELLVKIQAKKEKMKKK